MGVKEFCTRYCLESKKELEKIAGKENSPLKSFLNLNSQLILPFTKLERTMLAANFADVYWEQKGLPMNSLIAIKYAGYFSTAMLVYNSLK